MKRERELEKGSTFSVYNIYEADGKETLTLSCIYVLCYTQVEIF